jgi:integrase/recombinase XerD
MTRKQWNVEPQAEDLKLVLEGYRRYLKNIGLRDSTIEGYLSYSGRFLVFAGESHPPLSKAHEYRNHLLARNLSRQTVNNACIAIKNYYKMQGEDFQFKFLNANKILPFFFDQADVLNIFTAASRNIKHLAMLKVLFYCSLRASEICGLEDKDVNLKEKVLRVRNGKGGKDGIVYLTEDCAVTLKRYLGIRPPLVLDKKNPLFFTDYDNFWDRRDVYRMFIHYKNRAGITKPGGLHVFSRHTPATLMIKNGCDLRIVKELLRHNDIATTLRYAHVADETRRAAYDKAMFL